MMAISDEMQALRAEVASKKHDANEIIIPPIESDLRRARRRGAVHAYGEVLDLIDKGTKANAEGDELQEAEHAKKGN